MTRRLIGATVMMLMCALPARAAVITLGGTVVSGQGQFSSVVGATTVDFDLVSLGDQTFMAGIASYEANIFIVSAGGGGDLPDDTTRGARALEGVPLTIDFAQPIGYFGLYWGSPDRGNTITFFDGATQVLAFTGTDLNNLGVGFGTNSFAYVNFTAGAGEHFTRVVLSSAIFPFETDNHAFAVPEPTSLLLLGIGGLGLLTTSRRRKRQHS